MYIVTGGAGMIGSSVIWELNSQGISDILVVDNLASSEKWKNLRGLQFLDYIHRDDFIKKVTNANSFANFGSINTLIHMGACSSTLERNADFLMSNNFNYSTTLCSACLKENVRFINASSAATYGAGEVGYSTDLKTLRKLKPLNIYGYSKHLFDLWANQNNLFSKFVSLKFFNVYGPNEYHKGDMRSLVCKALPQIVKDGRITLFSSDSPNYTDGGQQRDFIYLKDCAKFIGWFIQHPEINGLFNVGTGRARTWNDLARAVFSAMKRKTQIDYIVLPAHLKGRYQYFTEANMSWMEQVNCTVKLTSLEDGIEDYLINYLLPNKPFLQS